MIVGCEDGTVFLVDLLKDQCIKTLGTLPSSIQSISWTTITSEPRQGPLVHVEFNPEELSPENPEEKVKMNLEVFQETQILLLGLYVS